MNILTSLQMIIIKYRPNLLHDSDGMKDIFRGSEQSKIRSRLCTELVDLDLFRSIVQVLATLD